MLERMNIVLCTLLIVFVCGCSISNSSQNIDTQANEQKDNANDGHELNSLYPVVLSDEEVKLILDKYVGQHWTAFEFPAVEEIAPGKFEYDCSPQTMSIWSNDNIYVIAYDVASSLWGNWFKVLEVIQEEDNVFKLNVEPTYLEVKTEGGTIVKDKWFDIDHFNIIEIDGDNEIIQFKSSIRDNEGLYFHLGTAQTSEYSNWLKDNGYFVNENNEKYEPILESKIRPNGYGSPQVNLYEAKRVVEDLGLVFDTNIPESEWENPKEYHFNYIIEGKKYYSFACKKGTTIFFEYD